MRTVLRRTAALVVVLALAAALAACSGGGQPQQGTPTTTARSTTGASASPNASPSPFSQTFDNGEPCPTGPVEGVPAGMGCVTTAEGDLDGDGTTDRFLVFARLGPDRRPRAWFARAVLGSGETPVRPIPFGAAAGGVKDVYPRAVGTVDANGDGRDEILVKLAAIIYHVAGQRILGMFAVDGGEIRPVTMPNGHPLTFVTGGIASLGQGAICLPDANPPAFVVTRAQKEFPQHWELTKFRFTWNGEQLVGPTTSSKKLPFDTDFIDPRILPYYGITCGSIHSVS
jgi:hypothetical protein